MTVSTQQRPRGQQQPGKRPRQQQGQFEDYLPNLLYRPNSRIKLVGGEEIIGTITGGTRYWYEVLIDGKQFIYINKGFIMYIIPGQAPQANQNVGAGPTNGNSRRGDPR